MGLDMICDDWNETYGVILDGATEDWACSRHIEAESVESPHL